MMGLPVKSVNDNTMPQQAIKTLDNVTTVVSRFRDAGYRTSYIHPFTETFYERNEVYPSYGFEDVYFEDAFVNLTEGDYHNTYIKDAVVFSKIKELLSSENEGYDCIYTMTMQNHQPYDSQDELSAYLAGVEKTCDALYDFLSWVREFDEKTVVVFIGDHYPFFSMESNVYSTFDINADNCYSLYNQTCYIFDSEKKITSSDSIVSAFYLPYFIMDRVGIEDDNVTRFFKSCYEMYPVYTTNVPGSPDKLKQVDMICYDLIVGEKYSLQK